MQIKAKRLISMLLTLVMVMGLLPSFTLPVFAAGDVCEIWRGGTLYATYQTLNSALSDLQSDDTIKLLANIDIEGQVKIEGTQTEQKNITFDLNGKIINLNNDSGTALYLEYVSLSLQNESSGAMNISVPVVRWDDALYALYSTVTVSSIAGGVYIDETALTVTGDIYGETYVRDECNLVVKGSIIADKGSGEYLTALEVDGDDNSIEVFGDVKAPWGMALEAVGSRDEVMIHGDAVGLDVVRLIGGMTGPTTHIDGDIISTNSSSWGKRGIDIMIAKLYIGGSVTVTNGKVDGSYGIDSSVESEVTVNGSVLCDGLAIDASGIDNVY